MARPDDSVAAPTNAPPSVRGRRSVRRRGPMTVFAALFAGALLAAGGLVLVLVDDVDDRREEAAAVETTPVTDDGSPSGTPSDRALRGNAMAADGEFGYGEGSAESTRQETAGAGDAPGQVGDERGPDAGNPRRPVPLDRMDIDVNRAVDPALGRAGTAADELYRRGRLGGEDTLAPAGPEGRLGSRVLTRARQEHHGIPVFAAEVVVTTEGERIVQIHGHPAPGIDLATTTPAHDYPATVALAEAVLRHDVTPDDEGLLVIVPVEGGYRLAWLGVVLIDRGPEQAAFDAETGEVLHRAPVALHAAAAARPPRVGEDGR